MKFHWGTRLFIGTALYMAVFITLAIILAIQKVDLVEKDYYPKAVEFQDMIGKKANTVPLRDSLRVTTDSQNLTIAFPSAISGNNLSGTVLFYCPGDKNRDFSLPIPAGTSGIMTVPLSRTGKGLLHLKIDCIHMNTGYYFEKSIYIP